MLYLLRIILVVVLIILVARFFLGLSSTQRHDQHDTKKNNGRGNGRKVSEQTGEYIDYEEIKEK